MGNTEEWLRLQIDREERVAKHFRDELARRVAVRERAIAVDREVFTKCAQEADERAAELRSRLNGVA